MFDHVQGFYQPTSVPAAVRLLRRLGPGGRIVAGATDLAAQADRSTRFLVDITRLGLDYVRRRRGGWLIGATTTMAALEEDSRVRNLANGILPKATATSGSVQLRNMATIGGNLANASPAADTATPLLALDASVVLQGTRGRRTLPLHKFFVGPHRTMLHGALLVEIFIPDCPPHSGWSFQKLGRTETDIAVVNVAGGLQCDRSGRCTFARIALGAVAPIPMRALAAEALLLGAKLETAVVERAAEKAAQEVRPITDIRASASYRRAMSAVLVQRALRECAAHAGCAL